MNLKISMISDFFYFPKLLHYKILSKMQSANFKFYSVRKSAPVFQRHKT